MRNAYLTTGTLVLLTAVSSSELAQGVPTSTSHHFDVDQPLPALAHALSATSHLSRTSSSACSSAGASQDGSQNENEGDFGSSSTSAPSHCVIPENQIQPESESGTYQVHPPLLSNLDVLSESIPSATSPQFEHNPDTQTLPIDEDKPRKRRFPAYRWIHHKYVFDDAAAEVENHLKQLDPNLALEPDSGREMAEPPLSFVSQRLRRAVPSIGAGVKRNPPAAPAMKRSNADIGVNYMSISEESPE